MRAIAVTMTLLGLAACSSDPQLMNTSTGRSSPDEFAILPTKPLSMPTDLNVLPSPTPGGTNITDPTPEADAVAALGGNPAALSQQGIGAADGALVNHASRFGRDPAIRITTAKEDYEWRSRNSRRALEILARTDVYYRAYEPMTLDSWAEQERWRPTGVLLPAAPPIIETGGLPPEAQESADRLLRD
ncbi:MULTISPECIES: DUF3035 domain-containing protein [Paracoccus]|jgi:hypothetical protein|uniref:DUF3035 domain-containing protein n=1 Tax=Paracoccus litorisediminis TaxID=2006130 RepID=A0A844HN61_9RHOB|nr:MULTISPECIES: DUF3035 domain-containing protein [Paracoccus]MBD9529330.1 DUF3035 domain-containing protein [Paracoccus sp. PAR01]MTH59092.1 DUF3035 domain-containing protein [Paracoccus litorisediminis]